MTSSAGGAAGLKTEQRGAADLLASSTAPEEAGLLDLSEKESSSTQAAAASDAQDIGKSAPPGQAYMLSQVREDQGEK